MSFPTTPCFIHHGTWSTQTRAHPAMNFMETYTKTFVDTKAWTHASPTELHTADFTLYSANGNVYTGAEDACKKGLPATYDAFKEHLHEPSFCNCWETSDGWEMIGQADVYANLHVSGKGEKVKSKDGKEWDVVTPGAFHFIYVRDDGSKSHGIKLKETRVFADSGPALMMMLKGGQVKPTELGL